MANNSLYYKWVPEWLKLPLLIIGMFPFATLLALFHTNTTFTASFLAVEPEHIQYFLTLSYAAVVVTLLVFGRLVTFIRLRSFLLIINTMTVFILYAISITTDIYYISILRVLMGVCAIVEGACLLPLLIKQLKTKKALYIGSVIMYFYMISGGTFTTHLVKTAIQDYGVAEMVNVIIYLHLLTILIVIILLNNNRISRKIPLYQIDWSSLLFLLISLLAGSYVLVFGRKYYWFEDGTIVCCTAVFLIFSALFIIKQQLVKRPLFNFRVLKYKNVLLGMLLFLALYILRASLGNIYLMMNKAWKWPWEYTIYMQYFNVVGTLLGMVASGILFFKQVNTKYIAGIGFAILSVSCFWFVQICYPDSTYVAVGMPLGMHGFGVGFLFTPISIYMVAQMPEKLVPNIALAGTATRFWGNNIGFMVIQELTYNFNQQHTVQLSRFLDFSNSYAISFWNQIIGKYTTSQGAYTADIMASKTVRLAVVKQASLLSNMEIFTLLGYMSLIVVFAIFTFPVVVKAIKKKGKTTADC